jgi:hypothetical protein
LDWEKANPESADYGIRFCSKIIEFMFIIYMQLKLVFPENLAHPFSQGWLEIFRRWANIDAVRDSWLRYGPSYSKAFQIFVEDLGPRKP